MGNFLAKCRGEKADENITPIPLKKVVMVTVVFFANNFSLVLVYPFLPFMVQDFYPELAKTELGWRVGYLGAAFNLGQLFGAIIWGRLSDRWGRRPVMLVGIMGTLLSALMFGFSVNYWMALSARFLWGALNGNIGVGKAYLSEVCDDSNMAVAFGFLGVGGGIGKLLGPALGGWLAQPAKHWSNAIAQDSIWGRFPYLLPCLVVVGACFVALVLCFIYLEEINEPRGSAALKAHSLLDSISDDSSSGGGGSDEREQTQDPKVYNGESSSKTNKSLLSSVLGGKRTSSTVSSRKSNPVRSNSLWFLLKIRNLMISCGLYAIVGFATSIIVETFPLWVLLNIEDGGFALKSSDIGLIMMVGAPFQLVSQLAVYPRMARRFGHLRTFRLSTLFVAVCVGLTPFLSVAAGVGASNEVARDDSMIAPSPMLGNSTAAPMHLSGLHTGVLGWITLCVAWTSITVVWMYAFLSTFVFINNSVYSAQRGTANGISQSGVAITRTLGPIVGGLMFAGTTTSGLGWPFDYHFSFHFAALCYMAAWGLSFMLSPDVLKAKVENETKMTTFNDETDDDKLKIDMSNEEDDFDADFDQVQDDDRPLLRNSKGSDYVDVDV